MARLLKVRPVLITLTIFTSMLIIACGASSPVGKYVSDNPADGFVELKEDGTFFTGGREPGKGFAGTYKIDGEQLLLVAPSGQASELTLRAGVIVGPDGERLIKEGGSVESKNSVESVILEFIQHPNEQVLQLKANLSPNDIPAPWELIGVSSTAKKDINCPTIGNKIGSQFNSIRNSTDDQWIAVWTIALPDEESA